MDGALVSNDLVLVMSIGENLTHNNAQKMKGSPNGYGVCWIITLVGNGVVVFGPILNDLWRVSSQLYWRFYQHSAPESMQINLKNMAEDR